jgi:hypothetical protein
MYRPRLGPGRDGHRPQAQAQAQAQGYKGIRVQGSEKVMDHLGGRKEDVGQGAQAAWVEPFIRHVVAPWLDYHLALAGWLAQAEIKLVKRRGNPDARRYGGRGGRP